MRKSGRHRPLCVGNCSISCSVLLLAFYSAKTFGVKVEKMLRVVFRLRGITTLKSSSRLSGLAIPGGGSDELHKVERDVFVAAAGRNAGKFSHDGVSFVTACSHARRTLKIITVPKRFPSRCISRYYRQARTPFGVRGTASAGTV